METWCWQCESEFFVKIDYFRTQFAGRGQPPIGTGPRSGSIPIGGRCRSGSSLDLTWNPVFSISCVSGHGTTQFTCGRILRHNRQLSNVPNPIKLSYKNLLFIWIVRVLSLHAPQDIEKLSALLTLYEEKPPTGFGFPSQRDNNAGVKVSLLTARTRC